MSLTLLYGYRLGWVELHASLKKMHAEASTIVDSIDKLTNFVEIQVEDDMMDDIDEVNRVTKTTLQQFQSIVQVKYIPLQ
jgi:adenylate cyclase class IV